MLFLDLLSPGTAGEGGDPEAVHAAMTRWLGEVRGAIEAHGGDVEHMGVDEVVAIFGVPRSRGDDALRAVQAAIRSVRGWRLS